MTTTNQALVQQYYEKQKLEPENIEAQKIVDKFVEAMKGFSESFESISQRIRNRTKDENGLSPWDLRDPITVEVPQGSVSGYAVWRRK